jgi:hypothetical protein
MKGRHRDILADRIKAKPGPRPALKGRLFVQPGTVTRGGPDEPETPDRDQVRQFEGLRQRGVNGSGCHSRGPECVSAFLEEFRAIVSPPFISKRSHGSPLCAREFQLLLQLCGPVLHQRERFWSGWFVGQTTVECGTWGIPRARRSSVRLGLSCPIPISVLIGPRPLGMPRCQAKTSLSTLRG